MNITSVAVLIKKSKCRQKYDAQAIVFNYLRYINQSLNNLISNVEIVLRHLELVIEY